MLTHLQNAEARSVSSIQALAWLNPIAENDSGNESESENVSEGLDHKSANSDQVRAT